MAICLRFTEGHSADSITGHELRNTIVVSASFTAVFTAYLALQNLQSSLNQEDGIGIISLSCLYACIIISSALAPAILKLIGEKVALSLAWIAHIIYTSCNFYPSFGTLIPASVLLGIISGPLWTSQCLYIARNSISLALRTNEDQHAVLSRFNGIFFTMYETTQITGNLISSLVLNQGADNKQENENSPVTSCGADDCPFGVNTTLLHEPEPYVIYTLLGVFLVFDLIGLIITVFCLPPLPKSDWSVTVSTKSSIVSCFSALSDWKLAFLVPLIVIMAMEQAVLWTDFTKSYISCPLGVQMLGFVMATYGGATTFSALVMSRLAKFTGRYLLFGIASTINLALFVILYKWEPSSENLMYIFISAATWGLSEGIWQTQSNSLIALLFPDNTESAFANYHCWKATGFTVYFVISNFLCVRTKLIIVMALLCLGVVLYVIVELYVCKDMNRIRKRRKTSNKT